MTTLSLCPGQVWAFDVDGTLIGSIRSDRIRPGAAALLEALVLGGATCVLWSAGGGDYAHRMATSHGLDSFFEGFYSKEDRSADGSFAIDHLSSHHRPDVFVDDAPGDVPNSGRLIEVPQFLGGNSADEALVDIERSLNLLNIQRKLVAERFVHLIDEFPSSQMAQYEKEWFTWGQAGAIDKGLRKIVAEVGLELDSAIAIVAHPRPVCLAAIYSVISQGRCVVMVSPVQSDAALAEELRSLRPAMVLACEDIWTRPGVIEAARDSELVGVQLGSDAADPVHVVGGLETFGGGERFAFDTDAAITVSTSGTTGPPKRLPVGWKAFAELGGADRSRDPRSDVGAVVLALPLATLGGLMSIARTLFGGRPLSMMERFSVQGWACLIKEHKPRVMGAAPPVLSMILEADIDPSHFEGVTAFHTSSAPVAPEIAAAFYEKYEIPVLLGYGATEFLGSVSTWTLPMFEEFGKQKLGSVGRSIGGMPIRIVDSETGYELGVDEVGLLEADPPTRPSHLDPGWLRTSDRARIDADGFIWILGRADNIIIRGGFKVDLEQVEASAIQHPRVDDAFVVEMPDSRLGSVPGILVTQMPGAETIRPDDVKDWIRSKLPPYAVPTSVLVVAEIPRTVTFKKDRLAARRLLGAD